MSEVCLAYVWRMSASRDRAFVRLLAQQKAVIARLSGTGQVENWATDVPGMAGKMKAGGHPAKKFTPPCLPAEAMAKAGAVYFWLGGANIRATCNLFGDVGCSSYGSPILHPKREDARPHRLGECIPRTAKKQMEC